MSAWQKSKKLSRDTPKAMTCIEPNQIYLIEVKEQSLTVATLVTLAMKFRSKKGLTIGKYSCLCSNLFHSLSRYPEIKSIGNETFSNRPNG